MPCVLTYIHYGARLAMSTATELPTERWADCTPGVRSLLLEVQGYCEKMSPNKMQTEDSITHMQGILYQRMKKILELEDGTDFNRAVIGLIGLFHEYRDGALRTDLVFRGFYNVVLSTSARSAFSRWLNVFVVMGNHSLRSNLVRQVDLNRTFDTLSEQNRERIVNLLRAMTRASS